MPSVVKTTGSKGLHVYVPIARGPVQQDVRTFAHVLAQELGKLALYLDATPERPLPLDHDVGRGQ